jgi:DNA-binding PadR family transcriptional regulator
MAGSTGPTEVTEVSEKELILLGLIAEEPIHAYGLEEKIRIRQMDLWTTIGFSSIYRLLTGLEEKKLIETQLEHEGQGATRKVHRLNQAGRLSLARGVLNHIAPLRPVRSPFSVALSYITQAPKTQVVRLFTERMHQAEKGEAEATELRDRILQAIQVDEKLSNMDDSDLHKRRASLAVRLLLTNAAGHMHAEREFLTQALALLKKEKEETFTSIELPEGSVKEGA